MADFGTVFCVFYERFGKSHRHCANPENPISVGQATGLSHTGDSAVPVGLDASDSWGLVSLQSEAVETPGDPVLFGPLDP